MERKKTPQERYAAKYRRRIVVDCYTTTEQDILNKLDSVSNKARYIKNLIRADIKQASMK